MYLKRKTNYVPGYCETKELQVFELLGWLPTILVHSWLLVGHMQFPQQGWIDTYYIYET